MTVFRHADPAAFLAAAAPVTSRNPAVAAFADAWALGLLRDPPPPSERSYLATFGTVATGLAMQRGGGAVVIDGSDPPAAAAFADDLAAEHVGLQGVAGGLDACTAFAGRWRERTGRTHVVRVRMRHHVLTAVADLPAPAGHCRAGRGEDTDWLVEQVLAFVAEAGVPETKERIGTIVPRRVADGRYRIWEVDGERAALAGYTAAGAHGARVGPVWTPVARRGRGYGTALVAALSRELLAAGAPRLFLLTDVGNPTSNAIYARIGYRPLSDLYHFDFVAPTEEGAS
jgi:ribosomal protein S18 acetylase RimI-like enzyme